jgi:DNA (cytosine-5)-methyltransferase 1
MAKPPAFHWQYDLAGPQPVSDDSDDALCDSFKSHLPFRRPRKRGYATRCVLSSDDEADSLPLDLLSQSNTQALLSQPEDREAVNGGSDKSLESGCSSHGEGMSEEDDCTEGAQITCDLLTETTWAALRADRPIKVVLPESTLLVPRSHYEPFEPPAPPRREREALNILMPIAESLCQPDDDFVEILLDEFAVYNDKPHYGVEMRSLHQLDSIHRQGQFYFDGRLSVGDTSFYVRGVPIDSMPIGNYGTSDEHTVRDNIWLCSAIASSYGIYYKLGSPAREYKRFFDPFLWVADLAKHFVDYLKVMGDSKMKVTIQNFQSSFAAWLQSLHGNHTHFLKWRARHPSPDFRTSIVANVWFFHKEAIGVLGDHAVYCHPLWDEIALFERYTEHPKDVSLVDDLSTVVTPYTYDCFEHLPFGDRLKSMPLSPETEALRTKTIQSRHLQLPIPLRLGATDLSVVSHDRIRHIKPGDTISTHRDSEESGSHWMREVSRGCSDVDRWFALVQEVHRDSRGRQSFDVTWYYRPVDTICGLMKYPWNNELFISDHCSCDHQAKIKEDEVIGVHQVDFGGSPATTKEFFCRQVYIHDERKWVTLNTEKHLACSHVRANREEAMPETQYIPGDTVLVHLDKSTDRSEPCEIVSVELGSAGQGFCQVRKLIRRRDIDPSVTSRPNELVYTEIFTKVRVSAILGRCHVRFLGHDEPISTPYDRDGVGGYFYITHQLTSVGCEVISSFPQSLRQSFDPKTQIPKLRGLDLFCGGGNFGRGLEDGGGIQMKWANDYATRAIHTYMANVSEDVDPFLGSIDMLHSLAIQGKFSKSVPRPGQVDFISGGSPCPGFSRLTNDKTTMKQRKNQSLVAAFASFIDLYRPKFGLLENVPGIVQKKANRDQDVFSQLICAIVGLGYQAQFYFLDASSCGSPQRRSRVFVVFAAPGCKLPEKPCQTHTHPPYTNSLGLGNLPNGEPMAEREIKPAPFKYVTAEEVTADLPSIGDGKPDICVSHPDHRVCIGMSKMVRLQLYHIPTRPFGMNFARAWFGPDSRKPQPGSGVLTESERWSFFPKGTDSSVNCVGPNSNSWGRQCPDRLIETIVTQQGPRDTKQGRQLHWHENRTLTLLEARRAQGFRDEEVLLGTPVEQYKIVGNSVAREVAVALGLAFREAWAETL